MKAIVWTQYGGPEGLHYREVEKPTIKANELLIKVVATSVFAGDCEIRGLKLNPMYALPMRLFFGITKPRDIILGQEFSGVVEEIGSEVVGYEVGQRVFGNTGMKFGAYAEYLALPAEAKDIAIVTAPTNIPLKHATGLVVGGIEALNFLDKVHIEEGTEILMNGAGGSIGSAAIQIAKNRGALITVVDASEKLDALQSLGADKVIDYRQEDYTSQGVAYDIVFDIVGKGKMLPTAKLIKPGGAYLIANPKPFHTFRALAVRLLTGIKIEARFSQASKRALNYMKEAVESDRYKVYVDREMPLSQMAQAHAYVDAGKKIGNLIIVVDEEERL